MKAGQILLLLLTGMLGCVEPYDFQVDETVEVMIIEAEFSNEPTNHQVRMSTSRALDQLESVPLSDATVWLTEDGNKQIDFTEIENGVYETLPTIAGKVGSSYVLEVRLKDGTAYQSSAQILNNPVEIDSVYGRYLELPSEESGELDTGVQFFVDTHDEKTEASFFRYEYVEDYIIRARYPSRFEWDTETQTYYSREEDISTCYGQNQSLGLMIATTSGLSENQLNEFPILMVSRQDPQLIYEYSILLKQHSISPSGYQYYKKLKENNESAGSFFDKQKGNIAGNISNVNNSSEVVFGFFEVSGVSSKLTFFTSEKFEDEGYLAEGRYSQNCAADIVLDTLAISDLNNIVMSGRNIYDFPFMPPGLVVIATVSCSDCRVYADNIKPDYWD
ncbi:MAG: DUF4249 domain-containing protein [Reichenbachiella sp.]|uniref:DUF4249 domain-containing protein n=1 Tax=Reichenbachiella sp. TaxID=2184521 RepID=UPI00329A3D49